MFPLFLGSEVYEGFLLGCRQFRILVSDFCRVSDLARTGGLGGVQRAFGYYFGLWLHECFEVCAETSDS